MSATGDVIARGNAAVITSDAISAGQFWILTGPDTRQRVAERMECAATQTDPTLPGES
jgi:hypothetical protein